MVNRGQTPCWPVDSSKEKDQNTAAQIHNIWVRWVRPGVYMRRLCKWCWCSANINKSRRVQYTNYGLDSHVNPWIHKIWCLRNVKIILNYIVHVLCNATSMTFSLTAGLHPNYKSTLWFVRNKPFIFASTQTYIHQKYTQGDQCIENKWQLFLLNRPAFIFNRKSENLQLDICHSIFIYYAIVKNSICNTQADLRLVPAHPN